MRLQRIYLSNREGFTLIELLIVLFIFSFIIGLVYNLYNVGIFIWKGTERKLWTIQEARMSLERIIREARGGKNVDIINNDKEGFSFQKPGTTTIVEFSRYKNDDKIRRYVNGLAGNIIATKVASFLVEDLGDSYKIEIKFEIVKDKEYYTVSGMFTPRIK